MFPGAKDHGEELVDRKIKIWWPKDKAFYEGTVTSFDHSKKKHKVTYTDGEIEILNLKKERWELVHEEESTAPVPVDRHTDPTSTPVQTDSCNQNSPEISSTSRVTNACSETVDVNGYKVKASIAPTLKTIFDKHGDIAANSVFKSASIRASLLEVVCDIVQKLQSPDIAVNTEAVETGLADVEAAKIEVSWLKSHFPPEYGRVFLMKGAKENALLSKAAAEKDFDQRLEELMEAQEKLREADERVKRSKYVIQNCERQITDCMSEWKKTMLDSNLEDSCLETQAIKRSSRLAAKKRGAEAGNANGTSSKKSKARNI